MYYLIVIAFILYNTHLILSLPGDPGVCQTLLDEFSMSTAYFTKCSVDHARPITMCDSCIEEYLVILDSYDNLTKIKENDTYCIDKYLSHDRLEVVETIKINAISLWDKASCNNCYKTVNGTLTTQPSKFKEEFDAYNANFTACKSWFKDRNETELCANCMDTYIKLNEFYMQFGDIKAGIDGTCMDIVDKMNSTQYEWSKKCCKYRIHSELIFLALSSFLCALPVLFYLTAKYFGNIRKSKILTQNRFAASLNTESVSISRR